MRRIAGAAYTVKYELKNPTRFTADHHFACNTLIGKGLSHNHKIAMDYQGISVPL